MPTGVHRVTDIPTREDVDKIKEEFLWSVRSTDDPPEIEEEGDGPWTVIATFPGPGDNTETFEEHKRRSGSG